jgi:hypothetical protein
MPKTRTFLKDRLRNTTPYHNDHVALVDAFQTLPSGQPGIKIPNIPIGKDYTQVASTAALPAEQNFAEIHLRVLLRDDWRAPPTTPDNGYKALQEFDSALSAGDLKAAKTLLNAQLTSAGLNNPPNVALVEGLEFRQ